MTALIALACGGLFGAGLTLSGMHDPARILAFLNLNGLSTGTWDATLALVFIAGLSVMIVARAIRRGTLAPLAAARYRDAPAATAIDANLIWGSILFGFGWGLAGLCPGPVLAAWAVSFTQIMAHGDGDLTAANTVLWFALAMLIGMAAGQAMRSQPPRQSDTAPESIQ